MDKPGDRITRDGGPPDDAEVEETLGPAAYEYWRRVAGLIDRNYPNVFAPEWLFGGKKHGWSLRYKKSRSFCTLVPEKGCFRMLIVFGAEERAKVEEMKGALSALTCKEYDGATTFHDGKWVLFTVETDTVLEDVMRLLCVKRKPKKSGGA